MERKNAVKIFKGMTRKQVFQWAAGVSIVVALVWLVNRKSNDSEPMELPKGGNTLSDIIPAPVSSTTSLRNRGASGKSEPTFEIYISDPVSGNSSSEALRSGEVQTRHKVMLQARGLTVNQRYKVNWSLTDPVGKAWPVANADVEFTATGPNWDLWNYYDPPEKPPFPLGGAWRWEARIDKEIVKAHEFMMTAPNQQQVKAMMAYEKGREAVFQAFARRWQYHDGFYFTKIDQGMLQIEGLHQIPRESSLSIADGLNGYTFDANHRFTFRAFRTLGQDGRWTDWKDMKDGVERGLSIWGEGVITKMPESMNTGFEISYSVWERDGHWRVKSDSGRFMVNGRIVTDNGLKHPTLAEVMKALEAPSSRKDAIRQGEEVVKEKPALDDEMVATMDAMRKRRL